MKRVIVIALLLVSIATPALALPMAHVVRRCAPIERLIHQRSTTRYRR